jgi:hypothetical protein
MITAKEFSLFRTAGIIDLSSNKYGVSMKVTKRIIDKLNRKNLKTKMFKLYSKRRRDLRT